jgi:hypothetical protein
MRKAAIRDLETSVNAAVKRGDLAKRALGKIAKAETREE